MMKLLIRVKKSLKAELISQLYVNNITIDENLLEKSDFYSEQDIMTSVSILVGSAAFWTSLTTIIKDLIKKSNVEIEFQDPNSGKVIKIKGTAKNANLMIEKMNSLIKEHNTNNDA